MNSELLRVVEQEAEEEARRTLDEARSQADQLLARAEEQARAIRDEYRTKAEALEKAAMARAKSAANLEAQALLLEVKSRVIESLFAEAAEAMEKLPPGQRRLALKGLLAEAAQGLSGSLRLSVAPGDADAARDLVKELKLDAEVVPDEKVRDGVVARTRNGNAMVLNRVADRLEQARPMLTAEIAKILWG